MVDGAGLRLDAVAWAAGFFDGDGGFTVKNRDGRLRAIAAITQSPERPGAVPGVLERFRSVVGQGAIGGPDLANQAFYWQTSSTRRTFEVFALLRPWSSQVKITQFRSVLDRVIASQRERRRPIGGRSIVYRAAMTRLEEIRAETALPRVRPEARIDVGVVVTAERSLKVWSNMDSAVGTCDSFRAWLREMKPILPILLIGLRADGWAPTDVFAGTAQGTRGGRL